MSDISLDGLGTAILIIFIVDVIALLIGFITGFYISYQYFASAKIHRLASKLFSITTGIILGILNVIFINFFLDWIDKLNIYLGWLYFAGLLSILILEAAITLLHHSFSKRDEKKK